VEPLMVIRNATLNFFQSFSFGYFRASLALSYLSAIIGAIIFTVLLLRKKIYSLAAIIAASCTFSFYLPPLPIYLYGSYLLILIAVMDLFTGKLSTKNEK